MRAILTSVLAALAFGTVAAAAPPDDAELMAASTRFALTATNDPAYSEALAAYCRLIRARIEGLPDEDSAEGRFVSRADLGSGTTFALVGRGWWALRPGFECHVLTEHPFWNIGSHQSPAFRCGQAVFVRHESLSGTPQAVTFVGISREDLSAAAAGKALPMRERERAEFPPLDGDFRKTDLPFQYDTWLPRGVFRKGELIPVYSVLRNRTDAPRRIDWWRNVYHFVGADCVQSAGGPDGNGLMDFALYAVRDGAYRWIESPNDGADFWTIPLITFPPRGSFVYTMLLNGAYDVSEPGEYEIWSAYRSNLAESDSLMVAFTGLVPSPPVRFRIVPPWHVTWGGRGLIATVLVVSGLSAWILLRSRRRAERPPPPPGS